jgi:hypothetical protein
MVRFILLIVLIDHTVDHMIILRNTILLQLLLQHSATPRRRSPDIEALELTEMETNNNSSYTGSPSGHP